MWITADDSQCPIHHAPIPPERILSTLLIQFLLSDEHRQADFDEKDDRKWLVGWLTAGFFALLAVIVSATLIALHLKNWSRPPLQKHIARILFMVPSYAVCAFVSYRFPDAAIYINLYRDVYEGFAVYSFFNLCLLYLGHTWDEQRESMMASSGSTIRRFPPPMCCFRYDPKHPRFLMYCKLGICQLVILRLFTSTFTIVLEMMGLFCPESMSWRFGHFWAVLFNFTGMGLSMFTLLSFYLAVHHDLPPGRPIYQFLAIKFVLFISYLQTFTLTLLVSVGVIKGNENWTPAEVINAIASFLTCFEMFGAAVLNVFAFSWREF
ncbi:organic solute transporter subunit alpha/Transmembrane protein, partial [Obelidium mucronatum]